MLFTTNILLLLILFVTVLFCIVDVTKAGGNEPLNVMKHQDAVVEWRVENDYLVVDMKAKGSYVAFGMHASHIQMPGADIVVCGHTNKFGLAVMDYHGVKFGRPKKDKTQDWIALSISQSDGYTSCIVKRKLKVCDAQEDLVIHDIKKKLWFFLTWGKKDNMSARLHYHANRVMSTLAAPDLDIEEDIPRNPEEVSYTLEIEAPPVVLPNAEGVEICSYHVLHELTPKKMYHITDVKSFYDYSDPKGSASLGMNHHMTLFACKIHPEWKDGKLLPLDNAKKPELGNCGEMFSYCDGDLVGQSISLRNDQGIPFGEPAHGLAVVFLRHFYPDSTHLDSHEVTDQGSTFQLTYTPTLRPKVKQTLIVQTTSINIPAKAKDFVVPVLCPSECTNGNLNQNVHIQSVAIHMHDRTSNAKKSILRHIRNGYELKPLIKLDTFEEGTSDEAPVQVNAWLNPGDELILECTYDNDNEHKIIWGSSLYDQMCVATLEVEYQTVSQGLNPFKLCMDNAHEAVDKGKYEELHCSDHVSSQISKQRREESFKFLPYDPVDDDCQQGSGVPPPQISKTKCKKYKSKEECIENSKISGGCKWTKKGKCKKKRKNNML